VVFVGLSADDQVWNATVFCKNRDRLLDGDIAAKFLSACLNLPQVRKLLSGEHFLGRWHPESEAWGQHEELCAEGRRRSGHREKVMVAVAQRRAATSTARSAGTTRISRPPTPDARLFRKGAGKEANSATWGI